jgi:molybdenum cofactor synthesis domain-containing protein
MNRAHPSITLSEAMNERVLTEGAMLYLAQDGSALPGDAVLPVTDSTANLGVGALLTNMAGPAFRVRDVQGLPFADPNVPAGRAVLLETLRNIDLRPGESFEVVKEGIAAAWIVLSDKGAAGRREDKCGPLIMEKLSSLETSLVQGFLIPDDAQQLKALLVHLALTARYDLILTSGGTGVGPRDISPETTLSVIDKRLPGFEQAMMAASLAKTPMGVISRAVCGTLGESLIINMPGSPKAVGENLEAVLPAIKHTIEKLQGDTGDCARV